MADHTSFVSLVSSNRQVRQIFCSQPFRSLLPFISAATISGNIAFNGLLPCMSIECRYSHSFANIIVQIVVDSLPPTSQISLDHGLTKVWVKQDGSFTLYVVLGMLVYSLLIVLLVTMYPRVPISSNLSSQATYSTPQVICVPHLIAHGLTMM